MDVFLIANDDSLEKYNTVWDKVSADIKKELDSESVYNKNLLKTKINIMVMKFHIFTIKNFLRWILIILV